MLKLHDVDVTATSTTGLMRAPLIMKPGSATVNVLLWMGILMSWMASTLMARGLMNAKWSKNDVVCNSWRTVSLIQLNNRFIWIEIHLPVVNKHISTFRMEVVIISQHWPRSYILFMHESHHSMHTEILKHATFLHQMVTKRHAFNNAIKFEP
jgi:hypothetical protein